MNVNKIILMGRLTAEPELKISQTGVSNIRFSVAVNRKMKQGESPKADFFNCAAFKNTAEFISKYFKKGSSIIVFGSVQFDDWTDRDGFKRQSTNIMVDEVQFGESKSNTVTIPTISEKANNSELDSTFFEEIKDVEGELPF